MTACRATRAARSTTQRPSRRGTDPRTSRTTSGQSTWEPADDDDTDERFANRPEPRPALHQLILSGSGVFSAGEPVGRAGLGDALDPPVGPGKGQPRPPAAPCNAVRRGHVNVSEGSAPTSPQVGSMSGGASGGSCVGAGLVVTDSKPRVAYALRRSLCMRTSVGTKMSR
jgi:hypothetical protein